ncbi:DUF2793 domain-containing protein [Paracoccus pacificus]|uniref:DUF2793 domain-containing protein n=1 Tax=Paracoccus pacificus TaxID=1463598 RepID=A0ABW4R814_9RHOB
MTDTISARYALPLLQPAQAQKHVTVNDALQRLDALTNLTLQSRSVIIPPQNAPEGACWAVPAGATDAWMNAVGKIATALNGGWIFTAPSQGMRATILDEGLEAIFLGNGWSAGVLSSGPLGAGMRVGILEGLVTVTAGGKVTTDLIIPQGAMVIGATAKVKVAITGTLTNWQLGTSDGVNRFGSGLGLAAGSWARGMLSQPMTYWNAAPLIMTATGGDFAAGKVAMAIHWLELALPS